MAAATAATTQYVSVSSQADTEQADLTRERDELAASLSTPASHRGFGVERLGDRNEGHPMAVERLHDPGEVEERKI